MSLTTESLYALLPAIIRQRDGERDEPLKALLGVLAREGRLFEEDLQRLHDNLFIETCDEWVVPYLGDLLGVRGLNETGVEGFSQRARVANTISYRRRKGTATMLEQLALDTTGWRARAGEFFERLGTTQWMNHVRRHARQVPDLRQGDALELLESPFDLADHTVDVRRITPGRGRYNLTNIGLFLWRLQSYPLADVAARAVPDGGMAAARGRFRFHPLGLDVALFNPPRTEKTISTLAGERDVPGRLRRRPLDAEVEAQRRAAVDGGVAPNDWFGGGPVISLRYRLAANQPWVNVAPQEMLVADLDEMPASLPALPEVWLRPPTKLTYAKRSNPAVTVDRPIRVAVDPVKGRIAFPAGVEPVEVRVTASHGFPGDAGGGAYDRRDSVGLFPLAQATWQAGVGRDLLEDPAKGLFNSFANAVAEWNAQPAGRIGVIALTDNGTYGNPGTPLRLKAGSRLLVVSADWPETPTPGGGKSRRLGDLTPAGRRAHLTGDLTIESADGAELWIDGLWIEGGVRLANAGGAGLSRLRITHSTLVPIAGALVVEDQHGQTRVELRRSAVGRIGLQGNVAALSVEECAVAVTVGDAVSAPDTPASIVASTVVGPVRVRELEASNSIFTAKVEVIRRQEGCVRFCFVPDGSLTPRRFRCQPDLALADAADADEESRVIARVVPDFTDEDFGQPAWLQLAAACPDEIKTGADDGAEMGWWHFLRQPQREANLRLCLDEYLRLGLEAGLIFVT